MRRLVLGSLVLLFCGHWCSVQSLPPFCLQIPSYFPVPLPPILPWLPTMYGYYYGLFYWAVPGYESNRECARFELGIPKSNSSGLLSVFQQIDGGNSTIEPIINPVEQGRWYYQRRPLPLPIQMIVLSFDFSATGARYALLITCVDMIGVPYIGDIFMIGTSKTVDYFLLTQYTGRVAALGIPRLPVYINQTDCDYVSFPSLNKDYEDYE